MFDDFFQLLILIISIIRGRYLYCGAMRSGQWYHGTKALLKKRQNIFTYYLNILAITCIPIFVNYFQAAESFA